MKNTQYIESARRTFSIEAAAINDTIAALDIAAFSTACELLLSCKGRVVITGIGKSGHIARKMASTLTSTGTPAFFLHPVEASHGDMGLLQSTDVLVALSKSGESEELLPLLRTSKEHNVPLIAITSNLNSELAKIALTSGAVLHVTAREEACPHDLAPTSSTTAQLVIGDALAIALLEARNFSSEDFARLHPAGALGRKLTMTVANLMKSGNELPKIFPDAPLSDVMLEISGKRLGAVCVVNEQDELLGIITDGDLRRHFQKSTNVDMNSASARQLMSSSPKTIKGDSLALNALQFMETPSPKVLQLPVIENNKLIGVIHLHDIVKAGIQ